MKSEADVDLYVFKWHFGFRVANLWLIIVGGSLINQLDPFIEKPSSIVDLLGSSVPGKSQVCSQQTLLWHAFSSCTSKQQHYCCCSSVSFLQQRLGCLFR